MKKRQFKIILIKQFSIFQIFALIQKIHKNEKNSVSIFGHDEPLLVMTFCRQNEKHKEMKLQILVGNSDNS